MNLRRSKQTFGTHKDFSFELSFHGTEWKPQGIWCYYVYLRESQMPAELFEQLWLEDKLVRIVETSPERVMHDYYDNWVARLDWHGGVTFYEKRGHTNGHRTVKFGCDFNHLWDDGQHHTEHSVLTECLATIDQIVEYITAHS